jgi:mevalonate kinase
MPIASAPGKLMLYGDHAVVHGKPCIVTAVDQRIAVSIEKRSDSRVTFTAPDLKFSYETTANQVRGPHPKEAKFVLVAVNNFFEKFQVRSGLDIRTKADIPGKFGFGSSSASTVAALKALSEAFNKGIPERQLFELAYKTVLDVQGVGSGFDVAAATWGGTIWYSKAGSIEVNKLNVERLPLVVGWTGVSADTPELVRKVGDWIKSRPEEGLAFLAASERAVRSARAALMNSDWKSAGEQMNACQELLESAGVSSNELRALITAAKGAGAWGAKLSGAGGGDSMIALAPDERKVADAIKQAGGTPIPVRINAPGVRLE